MYDRSGMQYDRWLGICADLQTIYIYISVTVFVAIDSPMLCLSLKYARYASVSFEAF